MQSPTVELARKLVQLPSLNPPGQEKDCIALLAHMLTDAELDVRTYEFAAGRPSLVARAVGSENAKPLAFTVMSTLCRSERSRGRSSHSLVRFATVSCSVAARAI